MRCFSCNQEFGSIEILLSHISRVHSHLSFFCCTYENCLRKFSLLNSFKKHCIQKHVPNDPNQINDSTPILNITSNDIGPSNTNLFVSPAESSSLPEPSVEPSVKKSNSDIPPAVAFLAKLHSYADVPRKRIVSIINDFDNFMRSQLEIIENEVDKHFERVGESQDKEDIKNCFNEAKNSFTKLKSEHLQLAKFRKLGTYISPTQYLLGERDEYKLVDGVQTFTPVKTTAEFIPIREVFKQFFETREVYIRTMSYYDSLMKNSEIITNFVQGSFWQKKHLDFGDKKVLPVFLYYDDYENNNALGSHAGIQKCGAIYISIPCLPPELNSKLSAIFLFVLFNTLDRKVFKNKVIFKKAIEELQFLENEGITIDYPSDLRNGSFIRTKLYFKLCLILGDNLGIHGLFGFCESFNSNFPCRFCMIGLNEFQFNFEEKEDLLRNESNYKQQVLLKDTKQTGIIEECIFHETDFHITKNICVDSMHDLFEGICQYDMAKMLDYFINTKKILTLFDLNERMKGFHYGWDNKPPEIMETHLKSKLKMSSSEMSSFMKNCGLLIGNLIPVGDPHWEIYVLLKKIIDIVLCPAYYRDLIDYFKVIIEEYLETLQDVFPGSIKPKHHFLTHYPRVMESVGPLWKCSSIRYESKHRVGKITSRAAICRINVCRTIAIKNQLMLNYTFLCEQIFQPIWQTGATTNIIVNDLENKIMAAELTAAGYSEIHSTKWVQYFDKKITTGYALVFPAENDQSEPNFFSIELMFVSRSNDIWFVVSKLEAYLDSHVQAYKIYNNASSYRLINSELFDSLTCKFTTKHGKFIVKNFL
ncbi:uncharacterized protein LOC135850010 [Planococcus citri]|uniref:uncharacterized protein LOC135850010 n=1 Tax=Planococcus citri TaxID=170843 RepID=UPI0031F7245C